MSRPAPTLKQRALGYLTRREHSRVELRRKLLGTIGREQRRAASLAGTGSAASENLPTSNNAPPEADVDALLDWLEAHDLLSQARFVETRVHARAARFGNLRIRQELAQHGLSLAPEAAQALQADELTRARSVWAKRFDALASDAGGRARQARFLIARGFSPDVVRRVIGGRDESEHD